MALICHLTETNTTDVEVAHVTALATTLKATTNDPTLEFRISRCAYFD